VGPYWNNLRSHELVSGFNFFSYGGLGLRLTMSVCKLDLSYTTCAISVTAAGTKTTTA
jgi:hypothetical protein